MRTSLNRALRKLCFSGQLADAVDLLCCRLRTSPSSPSISSSSLSSPAATADVDSRTYAFLLQEAINRKEWRLGRRIHAHMIVAGFVPGDYVRTKLLIFYAAHGDLRVAHHLFVGIPRRCIIPWNAMISGYVRRGMEVEAIGLYYSMLSAGLEPDQFTFASVFRACAGLASLALGRRVHCVMVKSRTTVNVVVNTALVDMYFKCSSPEDGRQAFSCSGEYVNVITWTALISGYGHHGLVAEVLDHFHQMIKEGFRPNHITFLAVLSACGHGGLVDRGLQYFSSMTEDYGIRPRGEHYAAVVDMLGRAGRLVDAYAFVMTSPCKQHSVIWGALLGACRMHGDLELLESASRKFFEMQPENAGKYVVLSNTYAANSMWQNAADVRGMMKTLGIKKEPSLSSVEVRGETHSFLVGDKSHKQSETIYQMIHTLCCAIVEEGCYQNE